MPFYEYQCGSCGHHLEAMQKFSDAPLRRCPSCGKPKLKKLMSAPVFRLKGSGWYETDFKSDKEGKRNLAGADPDTPKADATATDKGTAGKDAGADKSAEKPGDNASVKPAEKSEKSGDKPEKKADQKSSDKPAEKIAAAPSKPTTQPSRSSSASRSRATPARRPAASKPKRRR